MRESAVMDACLYASASEILARAPASFLSQAMPESSRRHARANPAVGGTNCRGSNLVADQGVPPRREKAGAPEWKNVILSQRFRRVECRSARESAGGIEARRSRRFNFRPGRATFHRRP